MEKSNSHIVFMIIASVGTILLMLFVVIDLFLRYKNKKLKHRNELLDLNSKFEKEILTIKNEVTEQVFNDISSELHENICQTLSIAVFQINHSEQNTGKIDDFVTNARNTISQAIDEIRNLSHSLSGDYWKNFDIYKYLKSLGERLKITKSIIANITISPYIEFDSKDNEIIVIRILQELVNNSIKHGKASIIDILIERGTTGIKLVYKDNGVGFIENKDSDGMGMLLIKQRLSLLKADGQIKFENQNGFWFESNIPIIKAYE